MLSSSSDLFAAHSLVDWETSSYVSPRQLDGDSCFDNALCNVATAPVIPHCGSDGVTYLTSCLFEAARCRHPQLTLLRPPGRPCLIEDISQTRNCQRGAPCSGDGQVHCGSNGVTYGSTCEFEQARQCLPTLSLSKPIGTPCTARPTVDTSLKSVDQNIRTVSHSVECGNRRISCPMNFEPHCGSNGITYGNRCHFDNAKHCVPGLDLVRPIGTPCETAGDSESVAPQGPKARLRDRRTPPIQCSHGGQRCPANYEPHCGSDGITYGNRCHFDNAKRCQADLRLVEPIGTPCGDDEIDNDGHTLGSEDQGLPPSRESKAARVMLTRSASLLQRCASNACGHAQNNSESGGGAMCVVLITDAAVSDVTTLENAMLCDDNEMKACWTQAETRGDNWTVVAVGLSCEELASTS